MSRGYTPSRNGKPPGAAPIWTKLAAIVAVVAVLVASLGVFVALFKDDIVDYFTPQPAYFTGSLYPDGYGANGKAFSTFAENNVNKLILLRYATLNANEFGVSDEQLPKQPKPDTTTTAEFILWHDCDSGPALPSNPSMHCQGTGFKLDVPPGSGADVYWHHTTFIMNGYFKVERIPSYMAEMDTLHLMATPHTPGRFSRTPTPLPTS